MISRWALTVIPTDRAFNRSGMLKDDFPKINNRRLDATNFNDLTGLEVFSQMISWWALTVIPTDSFQQKWYVERQFPKDQ